MGEMRTFDSKKSFTVERVYDDQTAAWEIHVVGTTIYFCVEMFERLTGVVVQPNTRVTIECRKVREVFC